MSGGCVRINLWIGNRKMQSKNYLRENIKSRILTLDFCLMWTLPKNIKTISNLKRDKRLRMNYLLTDKKTNIFLRAASNFMSKIEEFSRNYQRKLPRRRFYLNLRSTFREFWRIILKWKLMMSRNSFKNLLRNGSLICQRKNKMNS